MRPRRLRRRKITRGADVPTPEITSSLNIVFPGAGPSGANLPRESGLGWSVMGSGPQC